MSQIHAFLKQPVDISALADVEQWQQEYRNLDGRLSAWKFKLPKEYSDWSTGLLRSGVKQSVSSMEIMLHVTYQT